MALGVASDPVPAVVGTIKVGTPLTVGFAPLTICSSVISLRSIKETSLVVSIEEPPPIATKRSQFTALACSKI